MFSLPLCSWLSLSVSISVSLPRFCAVDNPGNCFLPLLTRFSIYFVFCASFFSVLLLLWKTSSTVCWRSTCGLKSASSDTPATPPASSLLHAHTFHLQFFQSTFIPCKCSRNVVAISLTNLYCLKHCDTKIVAEYSKYLIWHHYISLAPFSRVFRRSNWFHTFFCCCFASN